MATGPDEFAFPHREYESRPFYNGLTMRDYFAAQALMGLQCSGLAQTIVDRLTRNTDRATKQGEKAARIIARISFDLADAMLAQRIQDPTPCA